MDKIKPLLTPLLICITALVGLLILASAFRNRNRSNDIIVVTGLGSKDFNSDLVTWSSTFSRLNSNLPEAYRALSKDRELIQEFLVKSGLEAKELKFSAVTIEKQYDRQYDKQGNSRNTFLGNRLSQTVLIESAAVDKVEELSRQVTQLINQGLELSSGAPQYFYTKLPELKLRMIAEASRDARARAEQIAKEAGSDLGRVRFASMGVFQITAQNSNEDYSWGGTFNAAAKKKTASITMKLQFGVD